jgi:hypothetical protein
VADASGAVYDYPMTLRTPATEREYQQAKKSTRFMRTAPSLVDFTEWRIIENDYPYDKIAKIHHLLIPKRQVDRPLMLNEYEVAEYMGILEHVIPKTYDAILLNMPKQQSIKGWMHYHLLTYK